MAGLNTLDNIVLYAAIITLFWIIIIVVMAICDIERSEPLPNDLDNAERDILENELNELYYELELLMELSKRLDIDTASNRLTESEIRKALRNEKAIHATLKRIRKLESKLELIE